MLVVVLLQFRAVNSKLSGPKEPRSVTKLTVLMALLMTTVSCAQADSGSNGDSADSVQTVLITGANRGIGLELARQYAAAGWQVIGTARRPDSATELASFENTRVLQLDVTDAESVSRLADDLGDQAIDVLINNAGIITQTRTLPDFDFNEFYRVIAVNTAGPIRVAQALLPNLSRGKLKTIVNMTSNLGSIANNNSGGFYSYRESKAALNMFTRSLAAELRSEGFICIVMNPGWVQTDMGGPNAPLKVQDSVAGIRAVIGALKPADTGTFWSHDGEQMPW